MPNLWRHGRHHPGERFDEIALTIEMGAGAVDIVKTIQLHPKLVKPIGMTAEIAHGSCTDEPLARK